MRRWRRCCDRYCFATIVEQVCEKGVEKRIEHLARDHQLAYYNSNRRAALAQRERERECINQFNCSNNYGDLLAFGFYFKYPRTN